MHHQFNSAAAVLEVGRYFYILVFIVLALFHAKAGALLVVGKG